MKLRYIRFTIIPVVVLLGLPGVGVYAAEVRVQITNHKGKPLEGAVITAHIPGAGQASKRSGKTVIDQVNKEFVPHIFVIEKGTPVYFPNKDDIRHHVYSFSKPKKFELPLYKGTPANPVVFDKPGVIKLGCNIHDWMLGYVYVVDTPFHAITDKTGVATLSGLPKGQAIITVWHPLIKGKSGKTTRQITLAVNGSSKLQFQIKVRKAFRVRRAPRAGGRKY